MLEYDRGDEGCTTATRARPRSLACWQRWAGRSSQQTLPSHYRAMLHLEEEHEPMATCFFMCQRARHLLGRVWVYLDQVLRLLRQIRHLDALRPAQSYGLFCRYDHQEHTLRADKVRPGGHALSDHHMPSHIGQTVILQRLANPHEPVTVPAVQFVTPGLPGWVETDPMCMWVTWTVIPAEESSRCFLYRRSSLSGD